MWVLVMGGVKRVPQKKPRIPRQESGLYYKPDYTGVFCGGDAGT